MEWIVIVSVIVFALMVVALSGVCLYLNIKSKKQPFFIDGDCIIKSREVLDSSKDYKQCAEAFYSIAECGGITSESLSNTRKRKYKDSRESKRFCEMITTERISKVDRLDKATKYYG